MASNKSGRLVVRPNTKGIIDKLCEIAELLGGQQDFEYISSGQVCRDGTWQYEVITLIDGVETGRVYSDTGIACDEPKPIEPRIEKIRYCNVSTNTLFDKVCLYTFPDPADQTNVVETIISDTDTGLACEGDKVVTDIDYICNTETGFYARVETVITNGVVAEPTFTETTVSCVPAPCQDEEALGLITDFALLDGPVEDEAPENETDPDFTVLGSGDQNLPPSGINVPLFVGYENNTDDGFGSVQIAFETDAPNMLTLTPDPVMFGTIGSASAGFLQTMIAHNEPSGATFTITWILTGVRLGVTFEDRVTNTFTVA